LNSSIDLFITDIIKATSSLQTQSTSHTALKRCSINPRARLYQRSYGSRISRGSW